MATETPIEHQSGRFLLRVDGQDCVLDYRLEPGRVVFSYTGVPAALQGRGLAARLVEAGLQWAEGQGLQVVPACSYVASYLQRRQRKA